MRNRATDEIGTTSVVETGPGTESGIGMMIGTETELRGIESGIGIGMKIGTETEIGGIGGTMTGTGIDNENPIEIGPTGDLIAHEDPIDGITELVCIPTIVQLVLLLLRGYHLYTRFQINTNASPIPGSLGFRGPCTHSRQY